MPTATIKPGGGGDYTSLAAAWTGRKASGVAETWDCYTGGDMGTLSITSSSGVTVTSLTIQAAAGEQHDGTSGATGCYLVATATSGIYLDKRYISYPVTVKGLRVDMSGTPVAGLRTYGSGTAAFLFERNLGRAVGAVAGVSFFLSMNPAGGDMSNQTYRNNILHAGGYDLGGFLINPGTGRTGTAAIYNDTYDNHSYYGTYTYANGAGSVVNLTQTNVVITSDGTGTDWTDVSTGTLNLTATYCAAADATCPAGTGNTDSVTRANVYVTPGTNVVPKAGGDLYDGGTTIGSFSDDAIGTSRPQGSAWDKGAIEAPQASGNPYYYYRQAG